MQEQRKQQAASVEAYQANASQNRDASGMIKDDKDKKARDGGSSSNAKSLKHTQPAFSSVKDEFIGIAPSESMDSTKEQDNPAMIWKLTPDSSLGMDSIIPGTEHQRSVALEFNLSSMSEFLRDEHSDLKEPAEILQVITVTGSPQLAYADTAEAYLKWQWPKCHWASSFLQYLADACITHSATDGTWPDCRVPPYF